MESYLSKWARVAASVMSLTATNSSSEPPSWAARNRLRPIRPKPLIPTVTGAIRCALLRGRCAEWYVRPYLTAEPSARLPPSRPWRPAEGSNGDPKTGEPPDADHRQVAPFEACAHGA